MPIDVAVFIALALAKFWWYQIAVFVPLYFIRKFIFD